MKNDYAEDNKTATEDAKIKSTSLLSNQGVLLILSSNFLGITFVINDSIVTIGRSSECDMIINDSSVSKKHCEITLDDSLKYYIEDTDSKNSTFLNGKELKKKTHIIYGDRIIIGSTILRFFLEEKLEKKGKIIS